MVIKASTGRHINALVADLKEGDETARDAAQARLIMLGAPVVDRLVAVACDGSLTSAARVAAIGVLEGIGHSRALPAAKTASGESDDQVAMAAIELLRTFLTGPHGVEALDVLTARVLDATRSDVARMAALTALSHLESTVRQPILNALAGDPRPRLRQASLSMSRADGDDEGAEPNWLDDPAAALPLDPAVVRRRVVVLGARLRLLALQRLVVRIRDREAEVTADRRDEWMLARAAAHVALAQRGSRLGLYDLRESLDAAVSPLPVEWLSALTLVGDRACLESIVGAYARHTERAAHGQADWWSRHLADAFHTIVRREGLTRRHAVLRRAATRWPDTMEAIWRGQAQ